MIHSPVDTLNYHQLQKYAFRRFSVLRAFHTLLPTCSHYLKRSPLPTGTKPALCTMNILPPLMTVWYHFAKKYLKDRVDIVIFDSSGKLNPIDFPDARVIKFLNFYAAAKCDEFLYHIAEGRKIGWICDDDVFIVSSEAVDVVERELTKPQTASVSFLPRDWWHFEIDGKSHPVSSSYCTAINRDIFVDKESLSLAPSGGNSHPGQDGKSIRRYDTFDKANEILLKRGYNCFVVPEGEREKYCMPFYGVSGAVMLLWYFRTKDQTLDYFLSPARKHWGGNILYRAFVGMLAISHVQDLYRTLVGEEYPLPSLPTKEELAKVRREVEPLLRDGLSVGGIDEIGEQLRELL